VAGRSCPDCGESKPPAPLAPGASDTDATGVVVLDTRVRSSCGSREGDDQPDDVVSEAWRELKRYRIHAYGNRRRCFRGGLQQV
jgi:hypothetical protein